MHRQMKGVQRCTYRAGTAFGRVARGLPQVKKLRCYHNSDYDSDRSYREAPDVLPSPEAHGLDLRVNKTPEPEVGPNTEPETAIHREYVPLKIPKFATSIGSYSEKRHTIENYQNDAISFASSRSFIKQEPRSRSPTYSPRSRSPLYRTPMSPSVYQPLMSNSAVDQGSRSPHQFQRSRSPIQGQRSRSPLYRIMTSMDYRPERQVSPIYRSGSPTFARSRSPPLYSRSRSPQNYSRSRSPQNYSRSRSPQNYSRSPSHSLPSPRSNSPNSDFYKPTSPEFYKPTSPHSDFYSTKSSSDIKCSSPQSDCIPSSQSPKPEFYRRSSGSPQSDRPNSDTENQDFQSGVTVGYTYDSFFITDGRSKRKVNVPGQKQRYVCAECGKDYATSSNLSRHKQTHRSLDSQLAKQCPHCPKKYVSMPALSMHILTHQLKHQCPVCDKKFSRPWLLQGHLRSHSGEKPFGCAHCGKAFADRSNLRAHMQTHSKYKSHECGKCGKSFALKSYLNKHVESACTSQVGRDDLPEDHERNPLSLTENITNNIINN